MSREVRRVPAYWKHPKGYNYDSEQYNPLFEGYGKAKEDFLSSIKEKGLQEAIDWCGCPDINDYMPEWTDEEKTHYQMYETVSEGTPISPPMGSPELLARWLVDNNGNANAGHTASYKGWLRVANGGYAPSMIIENGVMKSGVEALKDSSH